jgi:hypothetical protein
VGSNPIIHPVSPGKQVFDRPFTGVFLFPLASGIISVHGKYDKAIVNIAFLRQHTIGLIVIFELVCQKNLSINI